MKLTFLSCVILAFFVNSTFAQPTSPRAITEKVNKRVEKRNEQTKAALQSGVAPGEKAAPAEPAPSAPPLPPAPSISNTNKALVLKPKAKVDKNSAEKKLVDFQKQRAMSGQASAQYDLGIRYLDGDGVEENAEEGRKWIEKAAAQNHTMAIKKLEELNKKQ